MIDPLDQVTLPLPVATDTPVRRHFVSRERAYSVMLTQDLFGDWVVMLAWCGRHTKKGGGTTRPVTDVANGLAMLENIIRQREKRGYVAVE